MTRIAITGINSYFAKTVLGKLETDPDVTSIVGIDVVPGQFTSPKIEFHQEDVRSEAVFKLLEGVDTVVHLAFIVQEIRDKQRTHDINLNGSINVFNACVANRVGKIVYTSSIASYGAHPDNPIGMAEDHPLRPNPDSYYSSDKATIENFLAGFAKEHPEIMLTILRPPVIVGPRLQNFGADAFTKKRSLAIKGRDTEIQFLHEKDLSTALYLAITRRVPGIYNIAADDYSTVRRINAMAGVKLINVSVGLIKMLANLFFALGLEKASQGWVSLMEWPIVVSSEKFKKATGWQPRFSTDQAFRDFLRSRS